MVELYGVGGWVRHRAMQQAGPADHSPHRRHSAPPPILGEVATISDSLTHLRVQRRTSDRRAYATNNRHNWTSSQTTAHDGPTCGSRGAPVTAFISSSPLGCREPTLKRGKGGEGWGGWRGADIKRSPI